MYIRTKHCAFHSGRYRWPGDKWWQWFIRIAFVHRAPEADYWPNYRYVVGCDFWLIPNFIWYQDAIIQDARIGVRHQTRIGGIKNWPFDLWLKRY